MPAVHDRGSPGAPSASRDRVASDPPALARRALAPRLRRWLAAAALAAAALASPWASRSARADRAGDLGKQISSYETEVRDIGAHLPRPGRPNVEGQERRLVDASLDARVVDLRGDSSAFIRRELNLCLTDGTRSQHAAADAPCTYPAHGSDARRLAARDPSTRARAWRPQTCIA